MYPWLQEAPPQRLGFALGQGSGLLLEPHFPGRVLLHLTALQPQAALGDYSH